MQNYWLLITYRDTRKSDDEQYVILPITAYFDATKSNSKASLATHQQLADIKPSRDMTYVVYKEFILSYLQALQTQGMYTNS